MRPWVRVCVLTAVAGVTAGCVTAAPGAARVRITRDSADVSACTPVGNIDAKTMNNLDPVVAENKAVGLNANVILNTGAGGVAYRCKGDSVPAQ